MGTTKFEITMTVEVVNVGNVPADPEALRNSITEKIEGKSRGNVVKIKSIMVTGKYGECPEYKDTGYGVVGL